MGEFQEAVMEGGVSFFNICELRKFELTVGKFKIFQRHFFFLKIKEKNELFYCYGGFFSESCNCKQVK